MHFGVLTIIPNGEYWVGTPEAQNHLENAVGEMLTPYGDGREWDWYSIGGRWTGALDGYDPATDPKNQEPCRCMPNPAGCVQCGGTGITTTWPTKWASHPGDIIPLAKLTAAQYKKNFFAVCCEHGWFKNERYEPWRKDAKFPKVKLPSLTWLKKEYPNALAVVVDCHN